MSDEFRTALGRTEDRLSERQDKLFERVEESVGRIFAKIDLRMDASDKTAETERQEIKTALGELRDGVAMQRKRIDALEQMNERGMSASAEGAARGAGQAAGIVAAATARVAAAEIGKGFFATTLGKIVALCVAFTAVVTAVSATPGAVRGLERFWHFVAEAKK